MPLSIDLLPTLFALGSQLTFGVPRTSLTVLLPQYIYYTRLFWRVFHIRTESKKKLKNNKTTNEDVRARVHFTHYLNRTNETPTRERVSAIHSRACTTEKRLHLCRSFFSLSFCWTALLFFSFGWCCVANLRIHLFRAHIHIETSSNATNNTGFHLKWTKWENIPCHVGMIKYFSLFVRCWCWCG